jgi:ferredoxin/thioredoxin reductase
MTDLLGRHAAIFLAIGASRGRDLDLPGHDLDGVLRAVEFLLNVNCGFRVDLGRRVVVVGGGNVAFDAARTALRSAAGLEPDDTRTGGPDRNRAIGSDDATPQRRRADARREMVTTLDVARAALRAGVLDVTVVALESPEEIPADAEEIAQAEAEGIRILYRTGPHRFIGENGRVTALETIDVASVFDDEHRFKPTFIAGTERRLAADTVILAVGQAADLDGFADARLDGSGAGLALDPVTLRTSNPRIWAGGDVAHGPRNLIDAIADGQRAAAAIHHALGGATTGGGVRVELRAHDGFRRLSTAYDAITRRPVPSTPTNRRIGFGEVESAYDDRDAWLESLRCLRCFDNVMLDPDLCILCGLCVDVCPPNCITIARADTVSLGSASQSVLLLDEDLCIRCGLCVNRCPPGALSMVHAKEVCRD